MFTLMCLFSHGLVGLKTQKVKVAVGEWVSRPRPGIPDQNANNSKTWGAAVIVFSNCMKIL